MKANSIYLIGFVGMVFIQLFFPGKMIFQSEKALHDGSTFNFTTIPVDPNDPFRGKYITLRYAASSFKTDDIDGYAEGLNVYVTLEEGANGRAAVSDISFDEPTETPDYVKAKITRVRVNSEGIQHVRFQYPFDRYYLNEKVASEIEDMYRQATRDDYDNTYAVVRVRKGRAVFEDVMIQGKSIETLVGELRK